MGEDRENKRRVSGWYSCRGIDDAAGDEGVAKDAGDDSVGEDRVEAMKRVAAFKREETGMSIKKVVGGGPWRILLVGVGVADDGGCGGVESAS